MNAMNLPGFDAEASLGPTLGIYGGKAVQFRISGNFVASLGTVNPQQFLGGISAVVGDCFGSTDQCIDRFCSTATPGPEKAKCFAACQKSSVCSGCRCSCSPNCNRTCLRECTRSTPSAILRCRGDCFPGSVLSL